MALQKNGTHIPNSVANRVSLWSVQYLIDNVELICSVEFLLLEIELLQRKMVV